MIASTASGMVRISRANAWPGSPENRAWTTPRTMQPTSSSALTEATAW
jgi:hypothetical protein